MTVEDSELRLIYITPERLKKSKRFLNKLQKAHALGLFRFLAIDEVHCCSQWGHDFRPDYKFLSVMKESFPDVPIMGLTATLTGSVLKDVREMLNIPSCLVFKAPLDRPNIRYRVLLKPSSGDIDLLSRLLTVDFADQVGIVYVLTIKSAESLWGSLRGKGVKAGLYHGSMESKDRSAMHEKWSKEKIKVIIATTAFGMGIDKPNVRFVIHFNLPKSVDNFYQESGRAGRDGSPSQSILLFNFDDIFKVSTMAFTERSGIDHLYRIVDYASSVNKCRRSFLSSYFGGNWGGTVTCDSNCDYCEGSLCSEEMEVTNAAKEVLDVLRRGEEEEVNLTACKLIDSLMGKGSKGLSRSKKLPKPWNRVNTSLLITKLLIDGLIKESFHFTPYSTISYLKLNRGVRPKREHILPSVHSISYNQR
ncbi:ATP-dependent DNA helicase [Caligus rogercresseyi]|uniref:ATP-dependent DNA helicase n=1 Tax=Caligus rogercresseyi TaxID=217165 RepID=A0A7T8HLK7_CALRO|nr:ATP-dependent DNA helicase [Caligus rogercresseyi]